MASSKERWFSLLSILLKLGRKKKKSTSTRSPLPASQMCIRASSKAGASFCSHGGRAELLPQPGACQLLEAEALCSDVLELSPSICDTDMSVQELFFEMREDFLFQSPIVLPPLSVLGLQHSPESPWSLKHVSTFRECFITDLKKQWFEHNGLIIWTLMLSHDQKNKKKS